MSNNGAVKGLTCPKCGGIVPLAEGARVVRCPFCGLSSWVRGESGMARSQVDCTVNREQAAAAFRQFLSSHPAIARDAASLAQMGEAFLAYIPIWLGSARAVGFAYGKKKVGKDSYESREYKMAEQLTWNGAACDLSEFGLDAVPLDGQQLRPYNERTLRASGMVFEPVGAQSEAEQAATEHFASAVHKQTAGQLDRVSQEYSRITQPEFRLVYYPIWVVRYAYHGRAFQVVVDGATGKILYGKAPGSVFYRAAVLVGGMAVGAFLAVDVSVALLSGGGDDNSACGAVIVVGIGAAIMLWAYRAFRHGEQYEMRARVGS